MRDNLGSTEVLNHGDCQTLKSGMSLVSFDDVAKIRGSKLIGMTELEQPDKEPDLFLLAISKGEQPTPGYKFILGNAYLDRETAVIEVFWTKPEADAVLPRVMTHPCIVVGLEAGLFRIVRAVDGAGALLGELVI